MSLNDKFYEYTKIILENVEYRLKLEAAELEKQYGENEGVNQIILILEEENLGQLKQLQENPIENFMCNEDTTESSNLMESLDEFGNFRLSNEENYNLGKEYTYDTISENTDEEYSTSSDIEIGYGELNSEDLELYETNLEQDETSEIESELETKLLINTEEENDINIEKPCNETSKIESELETKLLINTEKENDIHLEKPCNETSKIESELETKLLINTEKDNDIHLEKPCNVSPPLDKTKILKEIMIKNHNFRAKHRDYTANRAKQLEQERKTKLIEKIQQKEKRMEEKKQQLKQTPGNRKDIKELNYNKIVERRNNLRDNDKKKTEEKIRAKNDRFKKNIIENKVMPKKPEMFL